MRVPSPFCPTDRKVDQTWHEKFLVLGFPSSCLCLKVDRRIMHSSINKEKAKGQIRVDLSQIGL